MTRPLPQRLQRLLALPVDGQGNRVTRAAKLVDQAKARGLIRVRWVSRKQGHPQYYHFSVLRPQAASPNAERKSARRTIKGTSN